MSRNPGLDLIRCIAISYVVFLHAAELSFGLPEFLYNFSKTGWIGVDLFFVLSGFLIARHAFKQKESSIVFLLKDFWIRRWWRTLPLYYLCLFVYVVVKPLLGFPFMDSPYKFLVFFQNFDQMSDFTQSWSLCIEEHFYLVFPILCFALGLRKAPAIVWLFPILLSMTLRAIMFFQGAVQPLEEHIDFSVRFVSYLHLDGLSIGVFLAATFDRWHTISATIRKYCALFAFLLVIGISYKSDYQLMSSNVIWFFPLLSVLFAVMIMGAYDLKIPTRVNWPLYYISIYSYGIYLWNSLLVRLFERMEFALPGIVIFIIFYILSILIAIPTYYLVEQPFMRMRAKVLARHQSKFANS